MVSPTGPAHSSTMTKLTILMCVVFSLANAQFDGDAAYDDLCSNAPNRRANLASVVACSDGSYNGCSRDPRCCWDSSTTPRCYFKAAYIPTDKCTVDTALKENCLAQTARSGDVDRCLSRPGCCFNISGIANVPDCYREKTLQRCECVIHDDPFVNSFDSASLPIIGEGNYVMFSTPDILVVVQILAAGPEGTNLQPNSIQILSEQSAQVLGEMTMDKVQTKSDSVKKEEAGMSYKDQVTITYEGYGNVKVYRLSVKSGVANTFGYCGTCDKNWKNDFVVNSVDYSSRPDKVIAMMNSLRYQAVTRE